MCCPDRFLFTGTSRDDGELIATDAEYVRFGSGECGQESGQSNQYSIALRMPVKVVNTFKIVNVNQGKGVGCPAGIKISKSGSECPAVTGAGQLVC